MSKTHSRHLTEQEKAFFQFIFMQADVLGIRDAACYEEKLRRVLNRVVYINYTAVRVRRWPVVHTALRHSTAVAITIGHTIYFRDAACFPAPEQSLALQTHELVHTCQVARQGLGTMPWLGTYVFAHFRDGGYMENRFEREAYDVEEAVEVFLAENPAAFALITAENVTVARVEELRQDLRRALAGFGCRVREC